MSERNYNERVRPLTTTPTRHVLTSIPLPAPESLTSTPRRRRAPQGRPVQPGDPACWGWPPFNYGRELDREKAMRAFYAWHKRRCGICGQVPAGLVIDHDHNTALVRGLLCDSCNSREGVATDPQDVFARWRAVPAAALLGLEVVYSNPIHGLVDPMPFKVTNPVFLPDWAPDHYAWPPLSVRGSQPPAAVTEVDLSWIPAHRLAAELVRRATINQGGTT